MQEKASGQTDEESKGGNHGEVSVVRVAVADEGLVVAPGVAGGPVAVGLVTAVTTGSAF
jgi:hypothetical protein